MGSDGIKVPAQSQTLTSLGSKKVSELVGENFKFTVDGTTVTATGDVNNITEAWKEFDSKSNNTGHFVPIQFPAFLKKQKVKLEGTSHTKEITVDDDLLLVCRLEGLTKNVLTIKTQADELVMTIDFSGVNKK